MADAKEFMDQLYVAVENKTQWYDSKKLPEVLGNYRIIHSCVRNIYDIFIKKSKIKKDPYKLDKKISEVVPPATGPIADNEKAMEFGNRFSEYESILDFLCSYFNFSVAYMNLSRIKNLVDLNNSFNWAELTLNSTSVNTRILTELIMQLRNELDPLSANAMNDGIAKCSKLVVLINSDLKELVDFQHEVYKVTVRKNIFEHPGFNIVEAFSSPEKEISSIKKLFPAVMGKMPYYSRLIEEIVQEDQGNSKDQVQAALLAKLNKEQNEVQKKKTDINPLTYMFDALLCLGGTSTILTAIAEKVKENHDVLENQAKSLWQKFLKALRQAFNLAEPETIYEIFINDPVQKVEKKEIVKYEPFIKNLLHTAKLFSSLANKNSPIYKRLENENSKVLIDFLNGNLSTGQRLLNILVGLDEYFKRVVKPENRTKIKGMKIDLTTLKNQLVKTNQRRAEYLSVVEEEEQLRKLGIKNYD